MTSLLVPSLLSLPFPSLCSYLIYSHLPCLANPLQWFVLPFLPFLHFPSPSLPFSFFDIISAFLLYLDVMRYIWGTFVHLKNGEGRLCLEGTYSKTSYIYLSLLFLVPCLWSLSLPFDLSSCAHVPLHCTFSRFLFPSLCSDFLYFDGL